MDNTGDILDFAEALVHQTTDNYCSELQRRILIATLQGDRKTYDQIAEECGYSAKYVKQDVAPKLWNILSQALDQKVTKANVRATLEHSRNRSQASQAAAPATAESINSATGAPTAIASANLPPITASSILLVDDQPKNLRLLSDLLEEQGYEVQQAISGAIALRAVAADQPDLILLDIHMPEMDGYTVCQTLKADPATQHIPVIFISALDEAWDKVKAFSVGGSDYITKPFKVVEVLARVENQLKIQQLQRSLIAQNSKLQQAIKELQRLAALDEVTQVASRRRLDAYLLECWQEAKQTPLTLMLGQVENFNFYGEGGDAVKGDQCLYQVAQVLQEQVTGNQDLVGRYGTLTFAIILPQVSAAEGEKTAQMLLQQVKSVKVSSSLPATLSIGMMTVVPGTEAGVEALLEGSDRNLQQAKNQGGNQVVSLSL